MVRHFYWILFFLTMAGCGYTTGSLLPSNYKKIAVEPFENKVAFEDENIRGVYVPVLESNVRTAIIDRFLFDGNLHIADLDKADLVLTGALTRFEQDDLREDVNQNVQQYRIRVVVSLTLTEKATGKVIWKEPSFAGEATYFLTGTSAQSQSSAIDSALTDLATRVVERTIQNW